MFTAARTAGFALSALLVAVAAPVARAADGWQLLKSLAGEWESTDTGGHGPARLSYEVIANGSVVMETMHTGGPVMVNMYHRDGNRLMATHYCAAGSQPRMRAPLDAEGGKIVFQFLDITNLPSPEAEHMRDLTITMLEPDQLIQEWTGRAKGKDSKAVFRFKRK